MAFQQLVRFLHNDKPSYGNLVKSDVKSDGQGYVVERLSGSSWDDLGETGETVTVSKVCSSALIAGN